MVYKFPRKLRGFEEKAKRISLKSSKKEYEINFCYQETTINALKNYS